MPCYYPVTGYRSRSGPNAKSGAWPIVFNVTQGYRDMVVTVPCGRCIGCKLDKSRQWAIRCVHEASLHDDNCFITLTYSDNWIDKNKSLNKEDFVLFMKRLRRRYGDGIRFFHCGEYGEMYSRPHHHACIFNFDFIDKILYKEESGVKLYVSAELMDLWKCPDTGLSYGYSTIGEVTFESAAYVARYICKKLTGKKAKLYNGRMPEYVTMSRRPGLANGWLEQYGSDVYPSDGVVVRDDLICKPPRYYDKIYDSIDPEAFDKIKTQRRIDAKERADDNTWERLRVKEEVKKNKMKSLSRTLIDMEEINSFIESSKWKGRQNAVE